MILKVILFPCNNWFHSFFGACTETSCSHVPHWNHYATRFFLVSIDELVCLCSYDQTASFMASFTGGRVRSVQQSHIKPAVGLLSGSWRCSIQGEVAAAFPSALCAIRVVWKLHPAAVLPRAPTENCRKPFTQCPGLRANPNWSLLIPAIAIVT